jgi:hypothetical protein
MLLIRGKKEASVSSYSAVIDLHTQEAKAWPLIEVTFDEAINEQRVVLKLYEKFDRAYIAVTGEEIGLSVVANENVEKIEDWKRDNLYSLLPSKARLELRIETEKKDVSKY